MRTTITDRGRLRAQHQPGEDLMKHAYFARAVVRCAAASGIWLLSLVAAAVTAPIASADPAEGVGVSEGTIRTEETNCFETGDRRPVLFAEVDVYVPDRYTVTPSVAPPPPAWLGAPGAIVGRRESRIRLRRGLCQRPRRARPSSSSALSLFGATGCPRPTSCGSGRQPALVRAAAALGVEHAPSPKHLQRDH